MEGVKMPPKMTGRDWGWVVGGATVALMVGLCAGAGGWFAGRWSEWRNQALEAFHLSGWVIRFKDVGVEDVVATGERGRLPEMDRRLVEELWAVRNARHAVGLVTEVDGDNFSVDTEKTRIAILEWDRAAHTVALKGYDHRFLVMVRRAGQPDEVECLVGIDDPRPKLYREILDEIKRDEAAKK